jgi:hypothetical protein
MVAIEDSREVISIVKGKNSAGRMEALRAVSDVLHGQISAEDFDRSLNIVRQAQSLEGLSEKRRAFNDTYLETIEALMETFRKLNQ